MQLDGFIAISFDENNLDRYTMRTAILNALRKNLVHFKGCLLDVGCGKMPYKKMILEASGVQAYLGLDIEGALLYEPGSGPDHTWDGLKMPFCDAAFDTVMATEVLEHCPDPGIVLAEVYRVMKPGAVFFFTVPFIWPLHEVPHDEYRYTPFALQRFLQNAGFTNINIKATGGWHASLAQMLGLWVRRAPMGEVKKNILSSLLKPVIKMLLKKDSITTLEFTESQMIIGLSGIAYKQK